MSLTQEQKAILQPILAEHGVAGLPDWNAVNNLLSLHDKFVASLNAESGQTKTKREAIKTELLSYDQAEWTATITAKAVVDALDSSLAKDAVTAVHLADRLASIAVWLKDEASAVIDDELRKRSPQAQTNTEGDSPELVKAKVYALREYIGNVFGGLWMIDSDGMPETIAKLVTTRKAGEVEIKFADLPKGRQAGSTYSNVVGHIYNYGGQVVPEGTSPRNLLRHYINLGQVEKMTAAEFDSKMKALVPNKDGKSWLGQSFSVEVNGKLLVAKFIEGTVVPDELVEEEEVAEVAEESAPESAPEPE